MLGPLEWLRRVYRLLFLLPNGLLVSLGVIRRYFPLLLLEGPARIYHFKDALVLSDHQHEEVCEMAPDLHVCRLDFQGPEENVGEDGRYISYRELGVALPDHKEVLEHEMPSQVVDFVVVCQDLGKALDKAIVWRLGVGQVLAHEPEHGVLRKLAQGLLHVLEHALKVAANDAWVLNSLQVLVITEGHVLFKDVNLAHLVVI